MTEALRRKIALIWYRPLSWAELGSGGMAILWAITDLLTKNNVATIGVYRAILCLLGGRLTLESIGLVFGLVQIFAVFSENRISRAAAGAMLCAFYSIVSLTLLSGGGYPNWALAAGPVVVNALALYRAAQRLQ